MNHKINASFLLEKIQQVNEDAAALQAYWGETLPDECPPLPDFECKALVRKFPLDYLVAGIDGYAEKVVRKHQLIADGKEAGKPITTLNAKDYICAIAWGKLEEGDPKDRPQTERRKRRAMATLEKPEDFEAWHGASPLERQKALGTRIATKKAGGKR